jgi:hypothetical protein
MNEYISPAILLDEAEAFGVIKPLHCASGHNFSSSRAWAQKNGPGRTNVAASALLQQLLGYATARPASQTNAAN